MARGNEGLKVGFRSNLEIGTAKLTAVGKEKYLGSTRQPRDQEKGEDYNSSPFCHQIPEISRGRSIQVERKQEAIHRLERKGNDSLNYRKRRTRKTPRAMGGGCQSFWGKKKGSGRGEEGSETAHSSNAVGCRREIVLKKGRIPTWP